MNFDRFLSNYSPAEADWGIEESLPSKYTGSAASDLSHLRHDQFYPPFRPTYSQSSHSSRSRYPNHHIVLSTTQNFHRYISKYLNLNQKDVAIVERFKYNLVVSNLLDPSLVLSKNEQALKSLVKIQHDVDSQLHVSVARMFSSDGAYLLIKDKHYSFVYPKMYRNPLVLMRVLSLIIFLLKQTVQVRSNVRYSSRVHLFKFLLVVATRIVKFKRATLAITATRGLRSLDDFMIQNCKINKVLITGIIALKEHDTFSFLNKEASASTYLADLKSHLNTLLSCLLLNIRYSIRSLLPVCNGPLLEQYCEINGILVGGLFAHSDDDSLSLETITEKLNCFNNLRRFFICQLLTAHDAPQRNFFILKLYDSFKVEGIEQPFLRISERLSAMETIFSNHTSHISLLLSMNEKFKHLNSSPSSVDYANDDVLSVTPKQTPVGPEPELNLNNLIDKLTNLTTSLRYFKKYSQSISNVDDADECDEKISIFSLFESELSTVGNLYQSCMSDYKDDYAKRFNLWNADNATPKSSSQRNSLKSSEQFSPKSFHTTSSSRRKAPEVHSGEQKDDKKRLSNGLSLNLLTVLEEEDQKHSRTGLKKAHDSCDDLRLSTSSRGSYNQAAFEALTRKLNMRSSLGRFSTISMNSNISGISDLLASTQTTGDEDEGEISKASLLSGPTPPGMSKEDLKKRLEESFTRIYSLENENNHLKLKNVSDAPGEHEYDESVISRDTVQGDAATIKANPYFLEHLENTLSAKAVL